MIGKKEMDILYEEAKFEDLSIQDNERVKFLVLETVAFMLFLFFLYLRKDAMSVISFIAFMFFYHKKEDYYCIDNTNYLTNYLQSLLIIETTNDIFHIKGCDELKYREIIINYELVKDVDLSSDDYLLCESYEEAINLGLKPCKKCLSTGYYKSYMPRKKPK